MAVCWPAALGKQAMAQVSETPAHQLAARRTGAPQVTVERVDTPAQRRAEMLAGLLHRPARISPKFFYDEQGSALYGAIGQLDEYDLPRREAAIFEQQRAAIAAALPP